jgi:hypothetical protein
MMMMMIRFVGSSKQIDFLLELNKNDDDNDDNDYDDYDDD